MADPRGDSREMWTGIRKPAGLTALLALAAAVLAACGSGADTTTRTTPPPPISATTARQLADLSNQIADDLDAGETCSAAVAADELQNAVRKAQISDALRPGVEEVSTRLVNEVNCPPPPPPPEPEKKPKKEHPDDHGNGDHGNGPDKKPGHSDHGGFVPPGQVKIKGEEG
jgi:hypothetical protein